MISKVGLAIHNKPWLIEPAAALNLLGLWEQMVGGQQHLWHHQQKEEQERFAAFQKLFASSDVVFAPTDVWAAEDFAGFNGARVAVIPVQGPLMKSNFCGGFGTQALANMVRMADDTPSVESILLWIDSPGGTVDGTESFANVIKGARKHTTAISDGYMCSAAYWIGSSASEVFASSKTDIIGSIGTMISMRDFSKSEEARGVVNREYTATKSEDKNKAFKLAKAGDGKLLIEEFLDPINDEFLSAVQTARSGKINLKSEDVLTGKTYVSAKAKSAGLIDGILPFEKALQQSLKTAQQKRKIKMESNTPFQKTLVAAGAEAFAVVDGGFLLTEENLRTIEAAIASHETAVQTAGENVTAANTARDAAVTAQQTAEQNLATANSTIAERDAEIGRLNARITELEGSTDAPAQTRSTADKTGTEKVASWQDPEHPANAAADKLFGRKKA